MIQFAKGCAGYYLFAVKALHLSLQHTLQAYQKGTFLCTMGL